MGSRLLSRGIRTALAVAGVGLFGLAAAPGAWADVTITPTTAAQGGAVELTFLVPEDHGKVYTTKIEVDLPEQAPIGEVDPLSVPNWAPSLTYATVASPVPGIHGGLSTTIPRSVTWSRATGAPRSSAVTRLILSMGPLPKVGQLPFTVTQTYSDKSVSHWSTASDATGAGPVLTLSAAAAGAGAGAGGRTGVTGWAGMAGMDQPDPAAAAAAVQKASDGTGSMGTFGAGLIGGLFIAAMAGTWILIMRSRRSSSGEDDSDVVPAEPADQPVADQPVAAQPVGVGSGDSAS